MKTFYLSERADGRVILDTESHGRIIETIEAKTWADARELITAPVVHDEGRGYIFNDLA